jgi:hypothetical protein
MKRIAVFLIGGTLLLVPGCSNPRKLVLREQNKETVLKAVGESKKLSEDDKKALMAYLLRLELANKGGLFGQATAQQGSGGPTPAYGKTVGEMIEEQKRWQAEQQAEEEKAKRLAAEAKAKEDALAAELRKAVSLSVYGKDFQPADFEAGRPYDYVVLKCAYENSSGKNIRAFKGKVLFTDLFGAEIFSSGITISDPIEAGKKATWTGSIHYNQFMANHMKLRNTDLKDMKVVWNPSSIIFEDGTKLGEDSSGGE